MNQSFSQPASLALVVVDMQQFYCDIQSDFGRFYGLVAADYIQTRLQTTIPNIQKVLAFFRQSRWPVAFLRIASAFADRRDLHRFFREGWQTGVKKGYPSVYPLVGESSAAIIPELAPRNAEPLFTKTTFSVFNSCPDFEGWAEASGAETLVFAGLCTSQCVDTSARDASDHGFGIIHLEDCQADYSEEAHLASLYASRAVCGGTIVTHDYFLANWAELIS